MLAFHRRLATKIHFFPIRKLLDGLKISISNLNVLLHLLVHWHGLEPIGKSQPLSDEVPEDHVLPFFFYPAIPGDQPGSVQGRKYTY